MQPHVPIYGVPEKSIVRDKKTNEDMDRRYGFHPPKGDQGDRHEAVRVACTALAKKIIAVTPVSPEQSRALNALDEVMMLANLAISRNES